MKRSPPPLIHVSYIRSNFAAEEPETQPIMREFPQRTSSYWQHCQGNSSSIENDYRSGISPPPSPRAGWRVAFQPVLVPPESFRTVSYSERMHTKAGLVRERQLPIPTQPRSPNLPPPYRGHTHPILRFGEHTPDHNIEDLIESAIPPWAEQHPENPPEPRLLQASNLPHTGSHIPLPVEEERPQDPCSVPTPTGPGGEEPSFPTCQQRRSGGLARHYGCPRCSASYRRRFELNRHIKVSHIRPHKCKVCKKGFGHRNYVRVHIETVHLRERNHKCRLCGKLISTAGNLNVHIRTVHMGEKKYKCPICPKTFGQQCNMKTHIRRHKAGPRFS